MPEFIDDKTNPLTGDCAFSSLETELLIATYLSLKGSRDGGTQAMLRFGTGPWKNPNIQSGFCAESTLGLLYSFAIVIRDKIDPEQDSKVVYPY
jgi:hypothetical protein